MKHRAYKFVINFLFFHHSGLSTVYEIKEGKSTILPGLKYTLVTLLFGLWKFPFLRQPNSISVIEALETNFNGGEDFTDQIDAIEMNEQEYFVYRNILFATRNKIKKADIPVIVDIQNRYASLNYTLYGEENYFFLKDKLKQIDIKTLDKNDIYDFMDAFSKYEKSS